MWPRCGSGPVSMGPRGEQPQGGRCAAVYVPFADKSAPTEPSSSGDARRAVPAVELADKIGSHQTGVALIRTGCRPDPESRIRLFGSSASSAPRAARPRQVVARYEPAFTGELYRGNRAPRFLLTKTARWEPTCRRMAHKPPQSGLPEVAGLDAPSKESKSWPRGPITAGSLPGDTGCSDVWMSA